MVEIRTEPQRPISQGSQSLHPPPRHEDTSSLERTLNRWRKHVPYSQHTMCIRRVWTSRVGRFVGRVVTLPPKSHLTGALGKLRIMSCGAWKARWVLTPLKVLIEQGPGSSVLRGGDGWTPFQRDGGQPAALSSWKGRCETQTQRRENHAEAEAGSAVRRPGAPGTGGAGRGTESLLETSEGQSPGDT